MSKPQAQFCIRRFRPLAAGFYNPGAGFIAIAPPENSVGAPAAYADLL
jgi:hypothetical protein